MTPAASGVADPGEGERPLADDDDGVYRQSFVGKGRPSGGKLLGVEAYAADSEASGDNVKNGTYTGCYTPRVWVPAS